MLSDRPVRTYDENQLQLNRPVRIYDENQLQLNQQPVNLECGVEGILDTSNNVTKKKTFIP